MILANIIYYGSYLVFLFLVFLFWKYKKAKNKFAVITLILVSILFIYARFIEPNIIVTKYHKININNNAKKIENINIAVFSDFHIGVFTKSSLLKKAVEKVNQANPDFALIPGDLVYKLAKNKIKHNFAVLKNLQAPVYAVTGNHDNGYSEEDVTDELTKVLEDYGINVIDNSVETILIKNRTIKIIGLSDLWSGNSDYNLLKQINPDDISIVLTHNPDSVYEFPETNVNLVVSGHTHGGQIRIPFIYKYLIPTEHNFDKEIYNIRNMDVFVTPGIGTVALPFRFLMLPRIDVLVIN